MPIGASGRVLNEMCSSKICVDEYKAGELSGRIYNGNYSEPFVFCGVLGLLKQLEYMFDHFEYPQRTTRNRSFAKEKEIRTELGFQEQHCVADAGNIKERMLNASEIISSEDTEETDEKEHSTERGKLATFYVKVMFRKNATWQGTVLWLDHDEQLNFRSVLELLFLMDGALEQTKDVQ